MLWGCRATVPVPLETPAGPGAQAPNLALAGGESVLLTWLEPVAGAGEAEA